MNAQARKWHVYYVENCRHARPEPKSKFVVVVCIDEHPMGFLINSNINRWIQKDEARLASQARLTGLEHRFLDRDSWVDCIDLYSFADDELANERGKVSRNGIAAIRKTVSNSKTIVTRHKELILGKR
ncbi:MAG: hypothetical protein KGJ80_21335 [Chloroflexota bacterium]|nr:hypothetical protein [Chloroflexota bacterium]